MAVYEHRYTAWTGSRTSDRTRFLVIPKYAFRQVFAVRAFTFFLALCFLPIVGSLVMIYVLHNLEAFQRLGLQIGAGDLLAFEFGAEHFYRLTTVQGWFVFLTTVFVGPGLVSRDLVNNGLPLYLARPLSRAEYVLGKATVLAVLGSAITWIPMFGLFAVQASLAPAGWLGENLRIPVAIFLGSWIWIVVLALLALAISAWVRWRPVSALMLLILVFGGKLLAFMIGGLFRTELGDVVNLERMMRLVWARLYALEGIPPVPPGWLAVAVLVGVALASLGILHLRIRAYEVVR